MATPLLPFLPSLLLLMLSLSSVSEGATDNVLTAKDVVIQYWNLKFSNKPLPPFFLLKLSLASHLQLMATSNFNHGSHPSGDGSNPFNKANANAAGNSGDEHHHVTANYDAAGNSGDGHHHVTANYDAAGNSGDGHHHVTANYDVAGNSGDGHHHVTTNYDATEYSGDGHHHVTANYDAAGNSGDGHHHVTANYDAAGNSWDGHHHVTANYDAINSEDHASITGPTNWHHSSTNDNHATPNGIIRMVASDGATEKVAKKSSMLNIFFRKSNLTKGTIMPMANIKADMPQTIPFLPRSIATMLPFSSPHQVKKHFQIPETSRMSKEIDDTISTCKSPPSRGETKACLTSAEDLIDYITTRIGPTAILKNTENADGSEGDILIGEVKPLINGDRLTEVVVCHQLVFPYMVYLCHSVPKVKLYEADVLDAETREKINHGIAICHFDTSDWSTGHMAFVELGFKPGQIEVCHWIFEGEMAAFTE